MLTGFCVGALVAVFTTVATASSVGWYVHNEQLEANVAEIVGSHNNAIREIMLLERGLNASESGIEALSAAVEANREHAVNNGMITGLLRGVKMFMDLLESVFSSPKMSNLMLYFDKSKAFKLPDGAQHGLLQHKTAAVWQYQTHFSREITGQDCCRDVVGISSSTYMKRKTVWTRVTPMSFIREKQHERRGR
jgi:hypothetical protein